MEPASSSFLALWRGSAEAGRAGERRFGGRPCGPTSLGCWLRRDKRFAQLSAFAATSLSGSWSRLETRSAHCVRSARTVETSQPTKRAARADHEPCAPRHLACAPQPTRPRLRRTDGGTYPAPHTTSVAARQAVRGGGAMGGDEERSAGGGARSALRRLTRRACPSAVSKANAASCATRLQCEHRSAVGAKRRPPPLAPAPGTACQARTSAKQRPA